MLEFKRFWKLSHNCKPVWEEENNSESAVRRPVASIQRKFSHSHEKSYSTHLTFWRQLLLSTSLFARWNAIFPERNLRISLNFKLRSAAFRLAVAAVLSQGDRKAPGLLDTPFKRCWRETLRLIELVKNKFWSKHFPEPNISGHIEAKRSQLLFLF